jgi:hypothetical protein
MVDHDKRKSKSSDELCGMSLKTQVTVKGSRSLKYNVFPTGSSDPKYTFACDSDIITECGGVNEFSADPLMISTPKTLKNELST